MFSRPEPDLGSGFTDAREERTRKAISLAGSTTTNYGSGVTMNDKVSAHLIVTWSKRSHWTVEGHLTWDGVGPVLTGSQKRLSFSRRRVRPLLLL
jgi:hypothetical protein